MNDIARTVFAAVYPVIAANVIRATGINQGVCLDLGSGPGHLALAMAKIITGMKVISVDFADDALEILKWLEELFGEIGYQSHTVINNDSGLWFVLRKGQ